MKLQRYGKIINISSINAIQPPQHCLYYHTAKAGAIGFALYFVNLLARFSINVNRILSGPIRTQLYDRFTDGMMEELREDRAFRHPRRQGASPKDGQSGEHRPNCHVPRVRCLLFRCGTTTECGRCSAITAGRGESYVIGNKTRHVLSLIRSTSRIMPGLGPFDSAQPQPLTNGTKNSESRTTPCLPTGRPLAGEGISEEPVRLIG
jgi:NAD(P)-dependent dehydrogenase (short-subunit alcohol dehydrogenase family)